MNPTESPIGPDEPNRSRRWLQVLIVLARGAILWLVDRVGFSPD